MHRLLTGSIGAVVGCIVSVVFIEWLLNFCISTSQHEGEDSRERIYYRKILITLLGAIIAILGLFTALAIVAPPPPDPTQSKPPSNPSTITVTTTFIPTCLTPCSNVAWPTAEAALVEAPLPLLPEHASRPVDNFEWVWANGVVVALSIAAIACIVVKTILEIINQVAEYKLKKPENMTAAPPTNSTGLPTDGSSISTTGLTTAADGAISPTDPFSPVADPDIFATSGTPTDPSDIGGSGAASVSSIGSIAAAGGSRTSTPFR